MHGHVRVVPTENSICREINPRSPKLFCEFQLWLDWARWNYSAGTVVTSTDASIQYGARGRNSETLIRPQFARSDGANRRPEGFLRFVRLLRVEWGGSQVCPCPTRGASVSFRSSRNRTSGFAADWPRSQQSRDPDTLDESIRSAARRRRSARAIAGP